VQKRTAKRKVSRMLSAVASGRKARGWRRGRRGRGWRRRGGGLDELDEEEAAEGDFEREGGDRDGESERSA